MWHWTVAATFATGVLMSSVPDAHADPYRWCAVYGGHMGGSSNCGFITLEQCRATIMGMGGFCALNQFYDGRPYGQAEPVRRRKQK